MNILGLIPARGGSKRLPGKNILPLGGKPLIGWTIEKAIQSKVFCDVMVSTDSLEIANIVASYGVFSPELRPPELSLDNTSSMDVIMYSLDLYEKLKGIRLDAVFLLQPTSPFRSIKTIVDLVKIFKDSSHRSIISISKTNEIPCWFLQRNEVNYYPVYGWDSFEKRSQDLSDFYKVNGLGYLVDVDHLRKNKKMFSQDTYFHLCENSLESLDIDYYEDYLLAQFYLEHKLITGDLC